MKAGKDVHTLMREFAFPEDLSIGEFHGKASWAVKSIWREYAGWFHYEDGTTALYGVPRSSVDADLAELAGGAGELAERAQAKLDAGQAARGAAPRRHRARRGAGQQRGARRSRRMPSQRCSSSAGGTNLSETMWLRSEIAATEQRLRAG